MKISKNIKVKISTKPNIHIGDHFIYKDMNWVCLDVIDGNYLSITTSVWKKLPFDVDNQNNWKECGFSCIDECFGEFCEDCLSKDYCDRYDEYMERCQDYD